MGPESSRWARNEETAAVGNEEPRVCGLCEQGGW